MQFDAERMARLAGLESDGRGETGDLLNESVRNFLLETETEEDEEIDEIDEAEECGTEKMTESRLRKIISREIRSAIEELRKSRGKPIPQIRKRSRLI